MLLFLNFISNCLLHSNSTPTHKQVTCNQVYFFLICVLALSFHVSRLRVLSLGPILFFPFASSLCSIRAACCCSSYTLFFIRGFHAHTLFLYTYTYCCLHLLYSHTCVWLWLCDSLARSNTYNAIRLNFYSSMMAVVIQLLLLLIVRCYSLPSPYMHQVRVFAQNSPIIRQTCGSGCINFPRDAVQTAAPSN